MKDPLEDDVMKVFVFSRDDVTAGYKNFNKDKKMDFCLSIED